MEKEQLLKLLDDLLEVHLKYTDIRSSEFSYDEHDEESYWKNHAEYVDRVNQAKEYLNKAPTSPSTGMCRSRKR